MITFIVAMALAYSTTARHFCGRIMLDPYGSVMLDPYGRIMLDPYGRVMLDPQMECVTKGHAGWTVEKVSL